LTAGKSNKIRHKQTQKDRRCATAVGGAEILLRGFFGAAARAADACCPVSAPNLRSNRLSGGAPSNPMLPPEWCLQARPHVQAEIRAAFDGVSPLIVAVLVAPILAAPIPIRLAAIKKTFPAKQSEAHGGLYLILSSAV
jgi:hypothetical protein